MLGQILQHLSDNKLVGHQHHGSIKNRSTQTIVTEIYDKLMDTIYKIQDVYLGISSYPEWVVYRKMPEQVLLKSIKSMQVQVI